MSTSCTSCNKKLEDSDSYLNCDFCGNSFHAKCCDISNTKYKSLLSIRDMVTWMCPSCTKLKPLDKLNMIFQSQKSLEQKVENLSKEFEDL